MGGRAEGHRGGHLKGRNQQLPRAPHARLGCAFCPTPVAREHGSGFLSPQRASPAEAAAHSAGPAAVLPPRTPVCSPVQGTAWEPEADD